MPKSSPLILIGGGGHCKSLIGIAEKCGFDILGIIDRPSEFGNKVLDYKVVGNDDEIEIKKIRFTRN